MFIDFQYVKDRVPILDAAKFLQLELKESNGEVHQYRAPCPSCKAGGDRALAITPGVGYYCNAARRGGDQIAIVAHVKGVGFRQAAELLFNHFQLKAPPQAQAPAPSAPPATAPVATGLKPLENLDAAHELVKAINLPDTVAIKLGAGYCNKGLMRGYVALPLRLPTGQLVGYIGVKDAKLPKQWSMD